jgi:nicotinate-nucleotide pyrophosphorylase
MQRAAVLGGNAAGVDPISIGSLTHRVGVLDIGLDSLRPDA